ncbi:MAG TPA: hypothetical protein VFY03_05810 [Woeseiaceae bacterium]|nr:hypothetical protein [Woeseiaceae bacterium]
MIRTGVLKLWMAGAALAGCTSGTAMAQADVDPSWPDWLRDAMLEEYDGIAYEPLSLGPVKTVMPGEIQERQEIGSGQFYARSNDGSGADFECWFYAEPIDMGVSIANVADAVIESTSDQHGPVGFRSVQHVDAGAIDGSPFLALEWLYTVGEAPNALATLTKVRAAESDGVHVICAHSLPGYRKSFAEGFAELVRQLDTDALTADPYYQEVYVFSINELNTGFARITMTLDEEGDTRVDTTDAMLVPVSATEVATSDSTSVSWSTPDGYLINALVSSAENGELSMNLALRPDENGVWAVDGSFSGKPISAELGDEAEPLSPLGEMLATRSLLNASDVTSMELTSWVPDADPTVFTNMTLVHDTDSPGAIAMTMGPLKVEGEFDANGSMRRGILDAGTTAIVIERVFAAGKIP